MPLYSWMWCVCIFFFFNDTATTEIYTLSLHDALPIYRGWHLYSTEKVEGGPSPTRIDRKSTRLNSSHGYISYAVFCLKKKQHKANAVQYRLVEQHTPRPQNASPAR